MIKISTYIKVFFFIFIILVSNSLFAKKAAIVMDYETKEVLFEVNADTLNFPASLTKIMTLYIVFDYIHKDNLNWQTQLKVSKFAASESPSKLYLEAGTSISVEDAVMALIVKSANDVATVVAENISGTEKEFAKGDFVVMDFGALYNGYHADMTRTVVIGQATSKHEEIYNIVFTHRR